MEEMAVNTLNHNSEELDSYYEIFPGEDKRTMSEGSECSGSDSDQTYERSSISSFENNDDDIGECLDWPLSQQSQNITFNDVSDVLYDGNRLNKEINKLLKVVAENDKQDIPPFVGPQPPPWGEGRLPLLPIETNQSEKEETKNLPEEKKGSTNNTLAATNVESLPVIQLNLGNTLLPGPFQAVSAPMNVDNHWGYTTPVMVNNSNPHIALGSFHNPSYETDHRHHHATTMVERRRSSSFTTHRDQPERKGRDQEHKLSLALLKVKVTCRLEKQQRRREKNRECSRMFRVKQRVKEDALKRGKLDKEVILQGYMIESSRLRMAFQGLQRNDRICPVAKNILQLTAAHHSTEP